jgi:hypothetical protein
VCNDAERKTCGSARTSLAASARLVTVGSKAAATTYLRPRGRRDDREVVSATASINGGRRVRLNDKSKQNELPQAPSTSVEPKMLTGSGQKARSRLLHRRLGAHGHLRLPVWTAGTKSFMSSQRNRISPAFRLDIEAGASARNADGMADKGGWKKRTPFCNGADRDYNIVPPCKRADFQRVIRDERTRRTFTGGNRK